MNSNLPFQVITNSPHLLNTMDLQVKVPAMFITGDHSKDAIIIENVQQLDTLIAQLLTAREEMFRGAPVHPQQQSKDTMKVALMLAVYRFFRELLRKNTR